MYFSFLKMHTQSQKHNLLHFSAKSFEQCEDFFHSDISEFAQLDFPFVSTGFRWYFRNSKNNSLCFSSSLLHYCQNGCFLLFCIRILYLSMSIVEQYWHIFAFLTIIFLPFWLFSNPLSVSASFSIHFLSILTFRGTTFWLMCVQLSIWCD